MHLISTKYEYLWEVGFFFCISPQDEEFICIDEYKLNLVIQKFHEYYEAFDNLIKLKSFSMANAFRTAPQHAPPSEAISLDNRAGITRVFAQIIKRRRNVPETVKCDGSVYGCVSPHQPALHH